MTPLQSVHPSIHTDIETEPSIAPEEAAVAIPPETIVTHDINRLLDYLHDVDQMRAGDTYDLAEHLARIEDGLVDLGDYVRQQAARRPPPRRRSPVRIEIPVPYPMHVPTPIPAESATPVVAPPESVQMPASAPPASVYEPLSVHFTGARSWHASERAPSTVVPVSPTTLLGPLAPTPAFPITDLQNLAPTISERTPIATPAPSTRALTVDMSAHSPHMIDDRAAAPSIMSVHDDDGDVRIVEPFTVTPRAPLRRSLSPIHLGSPSTLTPSISILSSAHSDSVWNPPSSPRVPYTPTVVSSVPLPSPPISTPSELSTIPLSSPSTPVVSVPSPTTVVEDVASSQSSPSVIPPVLPSPPTRLPRFSSPALSDVTVRVTGPSIQQLKDALGNLRDLAERLIEQQLRANDGIEELRKRPPPVPVEIPFPMPAPPVSIPPPPTPPVKVGRPLSAIDFPSPTRTVIPEPRPPPYAPILSDIANTLRQLADLGQRPATVEPEPETPKAKTESVSSDTPSSTTGTSMIRDRFDRLRDRLIPPLPLATAPSQDSMRTIRPDTILHDPFGRTPPAGDHRDASPASFIRPIPMVRRPAAGRLRTPSPELHRARTAPLPGADTRVHSWHPPHGLRSEHEPHFPESPSDTETEEELEPVQPRGPPAQPKSRRPPREGVAGNVPPEKGPMDAIRPDPPKVSLPVCQRVKANTHTDWQTPINCTNCSRTNATSSSSMASSPASRNG